jgi:hypothetical protein
MEERIKSRATKRKKRILELWQEKFASQPVLADELLWIYCNGELPASNVPAQPPSETIRRSFFRTIRRHINFAQLWRLPQVNSLPVSLIVKVAAFRCGAVHWIIGEDAHANLSIRIKREKTFFGKRDGGMLRVEFCTEDELGWESALSANLPYSTPILAMADREPSVYDISSAYEPSCTIWVRRSAQQRYWVGTVRFYDRADADGAGYEQCDPDDDLPYPVPYAGR